MDNANQNEDLILMGDLNLNQLETNSKAKLMDNICQICHLQQLIDLLTRITKESSTLIDLIYVSELSYITTSGVIQLGTGDHFGIFASRASNNAKKGRQDHLMTEYHDFKGARSKFWGVSGSEDRGGGDNSIQFINIGRVGDKNFKELRRKIGGWKGG